MEKKNVEFLPIENFDIIYDSIYRYINSYVILYCYRITFYSVFIFSLFIFIIYFEQLRAKQLTEFLCTTQFLLCEPAQLRGQSIAFVMRWSSVRFRQPAFLSLFYFILYYMINNVSLNSRNIEKTSFLFSKIADLLCRKNFQL